MHHPGQSVRLRSSARTHTGRVRDNNEDNIHLWTQSDRVVAATVADGMGGAVAGEEASRIAVEAIRTGLTEINLAHPDAFQSIDNEEIIAQLKTSIRTGNINIIETATSHPELKGMGTTVTMAFIRGTHAVIGHVGDSRAYLVDGMDGHIVQITADHSFVQALVAAGHITEEEAEDHPMKNVLYRALGQSVDIEIDIYYERIRPGDRLILCSDGLTLHVRPHEIAQLAMKFEDPAEVSQSLVDLANQRGGRDNVSVIVIKAEPIEEMDETAEEDDVALYGDYDEDETLIASTGFGPSESDSAPNSDMRDGRSYQRKEPPSMFSSRDKFRHGGSNGFGAPDSEQDQHGVLGEGHDIYTPDQ